MTKREPPKQGMNQKPIRDSSPNSMIPVRPGSTAENSLVHATVRPSWAARARRRKPKPDGAPGSKDSSDGIFDDQDVKSRTGDRRSPHQKTDVPPKAATPAEEPAKGEPRIFDCRNDEAFSPEEGGDSPSPLDAPAISVEGWNPGEEPPTEDLLPGGKRRPAPREAGPISRPRKPGPVGAGTLREHTAKKDAGNPTPNGEEDEASRRDTTDATMQTALARAKRLTPQPRPHVPPKDDIKGHTQPGFQTAGPLSPKTTLPNFPPNEKK